MCPLFGVQGKPYNCHIERQIWCSKFNISTCLQLGTRLVKIGGTTIQWDLVENFTTNTIPSYQICHIRFSSSHELPVFSDSTCPLVTKFVQTLPNIVLQSIPLPQNLGQKVHDESPRILGSYFLHRAEISHTRDVAKCLQRFVWCPVDVWGNGVYQFLVYPFSPFPLFPVVMGASGKCTLRYYPRSQIIHLWPKKDNLLYKGNCPRSQIYTFYSTKYWSHCDWSTPSQTSLSILHVAVWNRNHPPPPCSIGGPQIHNHIPSLITTPTN